MTSTSVLGGTQITLQFDLDRNIDAAAGDVQSAINAAGGQLPKNLPSPPSYRKYNPADYSIIIFAVHSDVMPMTEVDNYAETVIAQQLSQLPGIAQRGRRRPAETCGAHPGRPGEARRSGLAARGRRQPHHHRDGRYAAGCDHRRPRRTTPSTTTISC